MPIRIACISATFLHTHIICLMNQWQYRHNDWLFRSHNRLSRNGIAVIQDSHHGDVIKWKHLPRYWPFMWGIHRSPVNSPHEGQWRGALMFSLICVWINAWVNNLEADDLRRYLAHYDVIIMINGFVMWTVVTHLSPDQSCSWSVYNGLKANLCQPKNAHNAHNA